MSLGLGKIIFAYVYVICWRAEIWSVIGVAAIGDFPVCFSVDYVSTARDRCHRNRRVRDYLITVLELNLNNTVNVVVSGLQLFSVFDIRLGIDGRCSKFYRNWGDVSCSDAFFMDRYGCLSCNRISVIYSGIWPYVWSPKSETERFQERYQEYSMER